MSYVPQNSAQSEQKEQTATTGENMSESSCDTCNMRPSVFPLSLVQSSRTGKLTDYNREKTMVAQGRKGDSGEYR